VQNLLSYRGSVLHTNKENIFFLNFPYSHIVSVPFGPMHCLKSVLKFQVYIHEGANLRFYGIFLIFFFNFKVLIPEYSPT
jgi:hypothetical protein